MSFRFSRLALLAGLIAGLAFSGCEKAVNSRTLHDKSSASATTGRIKKLSQPTMTAPPQEVASGIAWPAGMRRLAVLPINANRPIDDVQRDMDGIFRGELSKVVKYEIVEVPRQEMLALAGHESISSTAVIPNDVIRALRQKYAADAVMFIDFTVFRPYRPIAIGVRAKIVELRNMEVIWMADGILDTAEPDVSEMATQFAGSGLNIRYISPTIPQGGNREAASGNQVILQSPRLFAGFVAHEAFATLAPPPPPPPPK
ncbi:MAG: hypothetical protein ACKOAS_03055 [Verrucomicrobiota bacterium]